MDVMVDGGFGLVWGVGEVGFLEWLGLLVGFVTFEIKRE
jgi:hypothetical protein